MKLGKQLYLTLERVEQSHRIVIATDIRDVFSRWKASTRVSPIYSIERGAPIAGGGFRFRDASCLVFLGPIHPDEVAACCDTGTQLWATLGFLNNLVAPTSEAEQRKLVKMAKAKKIAFELWKIKKGGVVGGWFILPLGGRGGDGWG